MKRKIILAVILIAVLIFAYIPFLTDALNYKKLQDECDSWVNICRNSAEDIDSLSQALLQDPLFEAENVWNIFFENGKLMIAKKETDNTVTDKKAFIFDENILQQNSWFTDDVIIEIISYKEYDFEKDAYSETTHSVTFKKYFDDKLTAWIYYGNSDLFPICPADHCREEDSLPLLSQEHGIYFTTKKINADLVM